MISSDAADGVLGVDTATGDVAVALTRGGELVFETTVAADADGRPRHSERLLGEIEAAAEAGGGWRRVGLIAVGIGPGTFTGLRVGIATVRSVSQARGLAVAPVGSLAALARGIAPDADPRRPRLAAIDARRRQLFAGLYGPAGEELAAPFVAGPEELGSRLARHGESAVAAGDGSLRFREQLEAVGVEVLPDADPAHRMAARHVCALAVEVEPGPPEAATPMYLRKPDAELWREQRDRNT